LIENNANEKEFKKLSNLFNYFSLNSNSLIPYNSRKDIQMPNPPVGKEYRSMGVMEHNIDINFVRRLKGQGKCWSIDGANKMSKLLAIKANKGMIELVDNIVSFELSAQKLASLEKEIEIKQSNKKTYPMLKGKIPFQDCASTLGRKSVKKMLDLKDFSKMSPSF
ncbi:MAG: ISLre2 family transposase, partial [Romboutsia sp.]